MSRCFVNFTSVSINFYLNLSKLSNPDRFLSLLFRFFFVFFCFFFLFCLWWPLSFAILKFWLIIYLLHIVSSAFFFTMETTRTHEGALPFYSLLNYINRRAREDLWVINTATSQSKYSTRQILYIYVEERGKESRKEEIAGNSSSSMLKISSHMDIYECE